MESIRLYDSELKVMEVIWEREPVPAKEISTVLNNSIGWNKNTTYTILKKLVDKQIIERKEPNFICSSRYKRPEVELGETNSLIERFYNGSKKKFFAAFLQNEKLTEDEINELKRLIDKSGE